MNTAPIHDAYVRATLHNVAATTRSARPLVQMPPHLRRGNTLAGMFRSAALITGAVALVLYVAARV